MFTEKSPKVYHQTQIQKAQKSPQFINPPQLTAINCVLRGLAWRISGPHISTVENPRTKQTHHFSKLLRPKKTTNNTTPNTKQTLSKTPPTQQATKKILYVKVSNSNPSDKLSIGRLTF
jgi:hypothetical protein